jgi:allantoinase
VTRQLLAEEGFLYHMDDFSDDAPFWEQTSAGPIVIVPYALDSNDMKMWNAPSLTPDAWLKYALDTFDCLWNESQREPLMMSLGIHLRIMGRPGRVWALREFIEHVGAMDGVWFATRAEIARQFADCCPAPTS